MSSNIIQNKNVIEVYSRGPQGLRGYSAYEVAVQNGYTGTQAQWLASLAIKFSDLTDSQKASLKGDKGDQGPIGYTGATGKAFYMITCDTYDSISTTVSNVGDYFLITSGDEKGNLYIKGSNNVISYVANILGPVGPQGIQGIQGISISNVEQYITSTVDEGQNRLRVTLSDGSYTDFIVRNGSTGSNGANGNTVYPQINGTVLSWTASDPNVVVPSDFDMKDLITAGTSGSTIGNTESPVSIFENNLDMDTLLAEEVSF